MGIKSICTAFAEERISEIGPAKIIGVLDTTGASNKDQVVQFLEQVISTGVNEFARSH